MTASTFAVTVEVSEIQQLREAVDKLAPLLVRPCVILLEGELGAGKTTFVQQLVQSLGGPAARSPTYSLHQICTVKGKDGTAEQLDHLDLYRIKDESDLLTVGWQDILNDSSALVCVEWPDLVRAQGFPKSWQVWQVKLWWDVEEAKRWLSIQPAAPQP